MYASRSTLETAGARPPRYVAYYRVSTDRQSASGLGLEGQREAVRVFLDLHPGRLVAEFTETASGRKDDRPQLNEALRTCRIYRAVLVIARLDRLARNVSMVTRLIESGQDFAAADFLHANRFTIHVLAAVAEYESQLNSARMKEVVAATKARGVKVGLHHGPCTNRFSQKCAEASIRARRARSESRARDLAPIVWGLVAEGRTYREIADELNEAGIASPQRKGWRANGIFRLVNSTVDEDGATPAAKLVKSLRPTAFRAKQRENEISPILLRLRAEGASYPEMAATLDRRGIKTSRGRPWSQTSLWRYMKRALGVSALRPLGIAKP